MDASYNNYHTKDTNLVTHYCDICLLEEKSRTGVAFCVKCVEFLCCRCLEEHGKHKLFRQHKVLKGNDIPKSTDSFKLLAQSVSCPEHPDVEVRYKCCDHSEYVCDICVKKTHRRCKHIEVIEELIYPATDRERGKLCKENLNEIMQITYTQIEEHELLIAAIENSKQNTVKERKHLICQLRSVLDKINAQMDTEVDEHYKEKKKVLNKNKAELSCLLVEEKHSLDLLNSTLNFGDAKDNYVIATDINKKCETYQNRTEATTSIKSECTEISTNQTLVDVFKMLEKVIVDDSLIDTTPAKMMLRIENSSTIEEHDDANDLQRGKQKETRHDRTSKNGGRLYLKDPQNKKSKDQVTLHRECDLGFSKKPIGCVVLKDGRFVFIDDEHFHLRDSEMNILTQYVSTASPVAICNSEGNRFLIAYANKTIKEFERRSDENEMYDYGGFATKLYPRSLTKFRNIVAILFTDEKYDTPVCSNEDTIEIQIREIHSGKIVQKITSFCDLNQKELTLMNPRVILSFGEEFILVGDETHIRCFDENGKCVWYFTSYQDHHINEIRCLTMDDQNFVYAGGAASNNVHKVNSKRFMDNRVLIDYIDEPTCLVYDTDQHRLIVGSGDNKMHIYKWE